MLFGRVTGGDIRALREAIEQSDSRVTSIRDQVRKHHGRLASVERQLRELKDLVARLIDSESPVVVEEEEEE